MNILLVIAEAMVIQNGVLFLSVGNKTAMFLAWTVGIYVTVPCLLQYWQKLLQTVNFLNKILSYFRDI